MAYIKLMAKGQGYLKSESDASRCRSVFPQKIPWYLYKRLESRSDTQSYAMANSAISKDGWWHSYDSDISHPLVTNCSPESLQAYKGTNP